MYFFLLIHSEIYLKSPVENPILGACLLACFKENSFFLEEADTFVPHLHPATPPVWWGAPGTNPMLPLIACWYLCYVKHPQLLSQTSSITLGWRDANWTLPLALAISNLHIAISNFYQWQLTLIWPWYQAP